MTKYSPLSNAALERIIHYCSVFIRFSNNDIRKLIEYKYALLGGKNSIPQYLKLYKDNTLTRSFW